jgi:RNA polymerase sigma-70 factor, ECF subfamily
VKTGKLLPLRRVESSPAAMSDDALLAACGVGDGSALGALFDRYHRDVYRFLARVSRSGAKDLDDLVQATFVEVGRAAGGFRGRSAVRTWVLGVAANVARHHVRSEVRRRSMVERASELPQPTASLPDENLEHRQLVERLGVALAELPHHLREAFVMVDLEEVPVVEVARALGLREGTLGRRLHEARKALRAALGESQ